MKLLFTLSVIGLLICGNGKSWLLNLNMTFDTLWTGTGSGYLISILEKPNFFHLTDQITGAIDVKMDGS